MKNLALLLTAAFLAIAMTGCHDKTSDPQNVTLTRERQAKIASHKDDDGRN